MEAVCTALFQTIGQRFGIFDDVKREKVNAPDSFSGMLADIECWHEDRIVLLVEVKDRALMLVQLDDKLDQARAEHIAEILFIAKSDKHPDDAEYTEMYWGLSDEARAMLRQEWRTKQWTKSKLGDELMDWYQQTYDWEMDKADDFDEAYELSVGK